MAWEHFYFDRIKIGGGDIFTDFSDRYMQTDGTSTGT
jgi:hypothetical protein